MANISSKDIKWLRWTHEGAKLFSTCAKRQYMSIIVDQRGYLVATGYNGVPSGFVHCTDGGCPRAFEGTLSGSEYGNCLSIHSEINCLMRSDDSRSYLGTLYVNGSPCHDCAKAISSSSIDRVVCLNDPAYSIWPKARALLLAAGKRVLDVDPSVLSDPENQEVPIRIYGQSRTHLSS